MGLAEYKRKRHFDKTSEPGPKKSDEAGFSYVIQKHDASRLHYDFRLELDGVLKSWAVPKGPSLDPSVKRLAVEVEDHPVAYGSFEGTIPAGEYGGGTVLLWDNGSWEPVGNPQQGLKDGRLKFVLHGQKLHGGWSLIRTHLSHSSNSGPQWLLIKEKDDEAKATGNGDILEEKPLSVASKRDLEQIAGAKGAVWSSNHRSSPKADTSGKQSTNGDHRRQRRNKSDDPMPERIDVQLATLTTQPPDGDQWLHEIKFDGYRMICRVDGSKIRFLTRNHNDWTDRLTPLVTAAKNLNCRQAIIDGEVVVVQPNGTTDFQSLQNAFREGRTQDLRYYVFDLLYLDGKSLLDQPLEERKAALNELLNASSKTGSICFSDHVIGQGDSFKQHACHLDLEGIICKRRNQPYRPGRGLDWLKVKCVHEQEFVIGGYTEPSGARSGFGALLVGFYDDKNKLKFAGKVGTGFDAKALTKLHSQLKSLEQDTSPFSDLTRRAGKVGTAHWVRPNLVGQFKYGSLTRDHQLRHASFQGLREDKTARDVHLESAVPVSKAAESSASETSMIKERPAKAGTPTRIAASSASKSMKTQDDSKPKTRRNSGDGEETTNASRSKKHASTETSQVYDADSETFAGERLTHPQKVLYQDGKITKLQLAEYYDAMADWILPELAHRPVVLVRCPEGAEKECFYQKHPGVGASKCLRQIPIEESRKRVNYAVIDDVKGLIAVTQMGALEIHVWGSREDNLEKPDRLVFDLDPDPQTSWKRVVDSAHQIREFLRELGLASFVKTTGGKGLHLVVPIDRRHEWPEAKAFCKQVAEAIVKAGPDQFTSNMSKAARTNKIFIDYLRNGRGATAVVAYSTRARANATVSMPLSWDELDEDLKSDHFNISNAVARMSKLKRDPWKDIYSPRQGLAGPIKKLQSLSEE